MGKIRLQVIGGGDAFASGGRFNTCFHITSSKLQFLIDCGASSLVALKKAGIDLGNIDLILITHFHGDHFGGLPFLLLHEHLMSKRTRPLTIAGPEGAKKHINALLEAMFPQTSSIDWSFPLIIEELDDDRPNQIGTLTIESFPVIHSKGSNPHGLRITLEGRVIAFTGDTEWTDHIIQLADAADLFIAECFTYEEELSNHLNYLTLLSKRDLIKSKRIVLTHMNESMLGHEEPLEYEKIEDGKIYEIN